MNENCCNLAVEELLKILSKQDALTGQFVDGIRCATCHHLIGNHRRIGKFSNPFMETKVCHPSV